ncbi:unnamed protein product [Nippostrongylus brasiliensis]|uniref:ABC transmembrane type-1 domain-containing protein n=1 Tax=Nippostrongylus brasiliensis TaxID=27835 RepID=A0A158R3I1_NIPBR|nr:unnamed protein product [Nippostrongylus brasiliensis]
MKIEPLESARFSKRKKAPRRAGLLDVMRGASLSDYALLFVGVVLSIVNGAILPFNSFIFKACTSTWVSHFSLWDTQRGVERIKDGLGDKLGVILSSVGSFVGGISLGFYLSWKMTLVMLITVPMMFIATHVSAKLLSRASKRETYAYSSAAGLANEVIAGIRTVMAFNAQPFEIHRYEKELLRAQAMGIRKAIILAIFAALPLFLMFGSMAFAFWYGTTLVLDGSLTPGTIFAVFWSVLIATRRLSDAAPQMGVFVSAKMAAADIFAIIDRVSWKMKITLPDISFDHFPEKQLRSV